MDAKISCSLSLSLSSGAQGVVDAGLVPLCVEKLSQEDNTELKVGLY